MPDAALVEDAVAHVGPALGRRPDAVPYGDTGAVGRSVALGELDEELQLKYGGSDAGGAYYHLWSEAAGKYVSAELGYATTDPDYGVLRARSDTVGSWESFRLVKAGNDNVGAVSDDTTDWGTPPAPSTPSSTSVRVMAWNMCGDANDKCGNYQSTPDQMATRILGQLDDVSSTYNVLRGLHQRLGFRPPRLALDDGPSLIVSFLSPSFCRLTSTSEMPGPAAH